MSKLTIVLGRMEMPHKGHEDLLETAMGMGDKTLLLLGSAFCSRGLDNPWTYAERKALIEAIYPEETASGKLTILPLRDMKYRDADWKKQFLEVVNKFNSDITKLVNTSYNMTLVGMEKDHETAGCLDMFRDVLNVHIVEQERVLNATDLRAEYFAGTAIDDVYFGPDKVSPCVAKFLKEFRETKDYNSLILEKAAVDGQIKRNAEITTLNGGFPPIYVAVDGLIVWFDYWKKPHLLMITRKGEVGYGKYALPGGYLNFDEYIEVAAKRETVEETGLVIDAEWKLEQVWTFDDPKRSKRGRMITHVHHWTSNKMMAPKLTAGDDALTAEWVPLDKIYGMQERMFADHYHIIAAMLPEVEKFSG